MPAREGTGNIWTLEQAEWQTVVLLLQMLLPDLQAALEKVRTPGLNPFIFLLHHMHKTSLAPKRQPICRVHTVAPWLWKSHLASLKVLHSSKAAVKVNGYNPKKFEGLAFFFFFSREKAVNLTRKDWHYFFKVYKNSLQFRPCLCHSSNTQMNYKD